MDVLGFAMPTLSDILPNKFFFPIFPKNPCLFSFLRQVRVNIKISNMRIKPWKIERRLENLALR